MKGLHPEWSYNMAIRMRPWYTHTHVAPYTPKPPVYPRPLVYHPYYQQKWQAQARPHYVSPPIQPFHPANIHTYIAPNLQPTNPAITMRENAYMRPWQSYQPYHGWPNPPNPIQVNV